jgi:deoxyribonuclease I
LRAFTILPLILVFASNVFALSNSTDLRRKIRSEASANHHSVGYKTARIAILGNEDLERTEDGYVITDVYCEKEYTVPGPGKIPRNEVLNVEHTWPQSKFGGSDRGSQKCDLHHLFPSDSEMNGIRGNFPFGVVHQQTRPLKCGQSQFGKNTDGQTVFEPPNAHKGNVARALFYFAVRYDMQIDETQEKTLREWNKQDPVDQAELDRNAEIESVQGNRNPFVDHPEYADSIGDF